MNLILLNLSCLCSDLTIFEPDSSSLLFSPSPCLPIKTESILSRDNLVTEKEFSVYTGVSLTRLY